MSISLRRNQQDYLIKIAKSGFKIDALHTSTRNQTDDLVIDVFSDSAGIDGGLSSDFSRRGSPNFDIVTAPQFSPDTGGALTTNLVAYWKMEEAAGTRFDAIGNNDLSDNNTVTQAVGIVGNAGQFTEPNGEFLSIADNTDMSTGDIDFTFAHWVYLDTLPSAEGHHFNTVAKRASGQQEYRMIIVDASNIPDWQVSSSGGSLFGVGAASFGALSTGTWYFIVMWHDSVANTMNIQINNGAIDSSAYSAGVFDGTSQFRLGKDEVSAGDFMNGRIDEVGFWKRILTTQEKTDLYNGGAGNTPASGGTGTVISINYPSTTGVPTKGMIIADETLNSGTITYSVSRDDGTTFTTVTKETLTDISAQPSGTSMRWKAVITGDAELNDIALTWKT